MGLVWGICSKYNHILPCAFSDLLSIHKAGLVYTHTDINNVQCTHKYDVNMKCNETNLKHRCSHTPYCRRATPTSLLSLSPAPACRQLAGCLWQAVPLNAAPGGSLAGAVQVNAPLAIVGSPVSCVYFVVAVI